MKRLGFLVLFASLAIGFACYRATQVSYSTPQELVSSQWMIEYKPTESKLQLTMRYRRQRDSGFSTNDTYTGVTIDQLVGLSRDQVMSTNGTNVKFQLNRDAGAFHFEGWFRQGNGSGHFTFAPNTSFAADLSRQGFGSATNEQLLSLAMSDTGSAFIAELRAQGYDTNTVEQLVRMSNHGVRLDYLQGLKAMGYSVKTTELVVRMKDHGVSLNFIRELGALGYSDLAPELLIRTKDHGVSTSFINELKEIGHHNVAIDQLVRLKDHGVSASYIKRMTDKGYGGLPLEQYIRMKNRGDR